MIANAHEQPLLPSQDKQDLLATIDPVARLEKIQALMAGAAPG